jgi:hypothetical protein
MFVRHLVLMMSLLVFVGTAHANQEPTFLLNVKKPVGGNAKGHKLIQDTLRAREAVLKPALLAKTKSHPSSRLGVVVKIKVAAGGVLAPTSIDINLRNAQGTISDDSIKPIVSDAFTKLRKMPKDSIGATVEMTITILQP